MSLTDGEGDTLPHPWRLEVHSSLPSTSDYLVARASQGEPDGLAVLALRQTLPRATRGRAWTEPEGNLALSLLIRPGQGPAFLSAREAGHWAFVAGLAVFDAIWPYVADPQTVFLKWPNDIMVGDRKLGGILIDAAIAAAEPEWLVIGIGVNVASAPVVPGRMTACLADISDRVPMPQVLAQKIVTRLSAWRHAAPLEIRDAWRRAAHPPGTRLTVRCQGEVLDGLFTGIGEDGALLLDCGGECRVVHTGEILLSAAYDQTG
ncbi:biotin--[acetyl-CoA-carboxylase] ligase [Granulibacter bethesdensis]|uniref:biotin--[acetyl-CoA-carboxylase] ligase n=1 Tax=Granulibacter bethesdensis TaxID=364410 RepID=UPI0003F21848|nr:biotin--[acetyl-CoA-carboxylase] ligase [Granulibacter bethesdensis]AHJ68907.1 Biotin--[acetyl-CoA-carboxylase] synthetase [Granulibacter bethesdensis]